MEDKMDKKVTEIFFYLGLVFWLIAYLGGDKNASNLHKNQGFITMLLSFVPVIGQVLYVVYAVLGIVAVCNGEEKELPIISSFQIFKD